MTIIPEAPGTVFRPMDLAETRRILEKHGVAFPYVLYVGSVEARKNLPRLLEAYARLRSWSSRWKLVVVGAAGWQASPAAATAQRLGLEPQIHCTGPVEEADLPAFFSGADLFVFPSVLEGFGLPLLEAMACGTPVVTSSSSSLPEVAGDAAILVDPYDVDAIASAMRRVLEDPLLAATLRIKGMARAAQFTWVQNAQATIAVYDRVLAGSSASAARLEHRVALDLAASCLSEKTGEAIHSALLASSPAFAHEWLLRANGPTTILADSSEVQRSLDRLIGDGSKPNPAAPRVEILDDPSHAEAGDFSAAVWATPRPDTWRQNLRALDRRLGDGARLVVLTAGCLGWLLVSRGGESRSGQPSWPIRGLRGEIERRGYRVERMLSIGNPRTIGWVALNRIASKIGRDDLVDRFEAAYRSTLVPSRSEGLAALTLLVGRKGGPGR